MEGHRIPDRTDRADDVEHAVDATATARATLDEAGVITGWSEGASRLLGYAAHEVVGRPARALLAEEPERLPPPPAASRWHGTVTLRHRDGHPRRVRLLAHHRTADRSTPDWLVVSALAGARDEEVDTPLTGLSFAQSPSCAMAIYDTRLRLRRANAQLQLATDLTEDDMRGLRATEIFADPESEATERSMLRALATGEPQHADTFLRVSGQAREHAWSVWVSPLRDGDGRPHGVLVTAHDTTAQDQARKRLLLLNDLGTRIGSTLDLTRTCEEVAEVVVPRLADFVTVDLLADLDDPDPGPGPEAGPGNRPAGAIRFRRLAHRSVLPGVPEAVLAPGEEDVYPDASPPAESLASGHPVLVPITRYDEADTPPPGWMASDLPRATRVREFGVHSAMAVPLRARGVTLGVIALARHRNPAPFVRDDMLLAEDIAARAALSIDNARRYARERGTAMALQRSLLPRGMPRQPAVDVAWRYLPAGEGAGVGGDWFDVIPLSGARVALVVGDVVGHGIHASATMGRLRTAVRTLADVDLPPDELLTHLDDLINRLATQAESGAASGGESSSSEVGATCLYAVYDPVERRCTMARAGHPEPLIVRPGGEAEFLSLPSGPPLGLGGLPFEAAEVGVPEGSLLTLFTDGLVESRERGMDEGLGELRDALTPVPESLESLCDTVLTRLLPGRHADDIALLIARTHALDASQVATWDLTPDPADVAVARRHATEQLAAWGLTEAAFLTELIVSELVTNAIRHAEPPVQLRLIHVHDRTLICEVSDASGTAPHLRRARTLDESGRGLLLVAQLTRRWGTRHTGTGKTIWAEVDLATAAEPF